MLLLLFLNLISGDFEDFLLWVFCLLFFFRSLPHGRIVGRQEVLELRLRQLALWLVDAVLLIFATFVSKEGSCISCGW